MLLSSFKNLQKIQQTRLFSPPLRRDITSPSSPSSPSSLSFSLFHRGLSLFSRSSPSTLVGGGVRGGRILFGGGGGGGRGVGGGMGKRIFNSNLLSKPLQSTPKPKKITWKTWLKGALGATCLGFASLVGDAYMFAPPEVYPPSAFSSPEEEVQDAIRKCRDWKEAGKGGGFFYSLRGIKQILVFGSAVVVVGVGMLVPVLEKLCFWYFRWALGNCGPFTIKAGQWMSQYEGVLGKELVQLLVSFQDDAPVHSHEETRRILEEVYGKKLEEVFEEGKLEFIASGSIAQVYKARVEGRDVVVKVRHPKALDSICQDVEMLLWVSKVVSYIFPELIGKRNLVEIVSHFSNMMVTQLDLSQEARNIDRFRRNFVNRRDIVFPEVLMELCEGQVLVETFEEGKKAVEFAEEEEGCDEQVKKLLARTLIQNYLKMGIIDNFSHDDLHGGNVLVRWVEDDRGLLARGVGGVVDLFSSLNAKRSYSPPSSSSNELSLFDWTIDQKLKNHHLHPHHHHHHQQQNQILTKKKLRPQIVILDCGSVSKLSQRNFNNFCDLAQAFMSQGSERAANLMVERTEVEKMTGTKEDQEKFVVEMTELLDGLWDAGVEFRRIAIRDTFVAISDLSGKYGIPLDPVFTTRMLGTCLVESLSRELNPDVDFITEGAAFFATDHEVRRKTIRRFTALCKYETKQFLEKYV